MVQNYSTEQLTQLIANQSFFIEVKCVEQGVYVLLLVTCTSYWLPLDLLVVDMYTDNDNTSVASLLEEKFSVGEPPLPGVMLLWILCLFLIFVICVYLFM